MNAQKGRAVILGAALVALSPLTQAADNLGKIEYDNNCAVCHGVKGKGDGPLAGIIQTRIPDLTTIQKNNAGVFPFNNVYEVVDGRADTAAHGSRDMPVWGNEYNDKAAEHYGDFYGKFDAESFVRGRILALINYIFTMQEK